MHITSLSRPPAFLASSRSWPEAPDRAANQAIAEFGLRQKGWRGFDELPWVKEVKQRFPSAISLAQSCSAHRPEYRQQAVELFDACAPSDRPLLRDYFAGKLGLEELSCQLSGAGAGSCDKRAAYMEIYRIAQQACSPNTQAEGALYL